MATLAELRTQLSAIAAIEGTARMSPTQQTYYLNETKRELCRHLEARYNQTNASVNTAAGNPAIAFPAGLTKLYQAYYAGSGGRVDLTWCPSLEALDDACSPDAAQGDPLFITSWGESFILRPTPSSIIPIQLYYYFNTADLVNDADHDAVTDGCGAALVTLTLGLFGSLYLMEDTRAQAFYTVAMKLIDSINAQETRAASMAYRPRSLTPGENGGRL